ncbi:glutathione S-transferase 1-like [Physella acuta]|uniref:glutathione S-transferase 1-like n=1 Tax=Physella acuta TaxID=109671 RepID=UPI0027DD2A22|nr:glutathione S-transferase 1-like [Physella acuta]
MAPKLKLIYFDARSRAEVSRLLLALAGQKYEDVRISKQNWPEEKPKTLFGQVPMLEVDGVLYAQSVAIEAYLAREFNFYGKSPLDQLKVDQVVQLNQEYRAKAMTALKERDEARKAELMKNVKEVESPLYLGFLEKLLKENGTGYFVGSSLTYADISTYDNIFAFTTRGSFVTRPNDDLPFLKELFNIVENNERIKAYLASRKQTET